MWRRIEDTHPRHPYHYVLCDRCGRRSADDVDHDAFLAMIDANGWMREEFTHAGCGGIQTGVTCETPSPSFAWVGR
jgi:hypothetical protein